MPASKKSSKKSYLASAPTAFAGANTGSGFISFYDSIFSEEKLAGLYIIKGGSGTGKSTFMKKLGEVAAKSGCACEKYLCGSDEDSLDGLLIHGKTGKTVGVIDGTPPHPKELRSPGAAGDILNFGEFWDSCGLMEKRSEIEGIVKEKGVLFDTAYRYLGAAERINRHVSTLAAGAYLREKSAAAASRLVSSIGVRGKACNRQLSGYTMKGCASLAPAFGEIREYIVMGDSDFGKLFLADAESCIKEKGISAQISRSPLNLTSVEGIYFPESRVWLHIGCIDDSSSPEKIINVRRFIDSEKLSSFRQRLRFGQKCRKALLEGAEQSLAVAREKHFALEAIYKDYMNFDALEEKAEIWRKEILSRVE